MNLAAFQAAFPEFAHVDEALIQSKLDQASESVGASTWGTSYDEGLGYLAAHLLSTAPLGQDARLSPSDETSHYHEHYQRLLRVAACGIRCL